jgi:hypothetical protein
MVFFMENQKDSASVPQIKSQSSVEWQNTTYPTIQNDMKARSDL